MSHTFEFGGAVKLSHRYRMGDRFLSRRGLPEVPLDPVFYIREVNEASGELVVEHHRLDQTSYGPNLKGIRWAVPFAEATKYPPLAPKVTEAAIKNDDVYQVVAEGYAKETGRKDDGGKLDLTLLFDDLPHALEGVAEVLQWAVRDKKPKPYERGSWQGVDDFQRRYRAAMFRHTLNASKGAIVNGVPIEAATDWETGLLELAHIATDALFMLEMAKREIIKRKEGK